jgi:hypothetical protein
LKNVKNSYMQLTLIFQQQHEIEVTSYSDPLLEAHHPLHCVCLLYKKMKMCSVSMQHCFLSTTDSCTSLEFKFMIFSFCDFCNNSINYILYTVIYEYSEMWLLADLFTERQKCSAPDLYNIIINMRWQNCPYAKKWKYKTQAHNSLYKNYPFYRNLNSWNSCSFRNFTHSQTRVSKYLHLLSYIN